MELSGRPLFDNPLDAALFVDREEAGLLRANCKDGINTLLLGGRGMGKTSLLRHVLFELREAEFPAVGVDAASAEGTLDLIRMIVAALGRVKLEGPQIDLLSAVGLGETAAILRELRKLRPESADAGPRTAILIDLPAGARTMHQLFGRFRDELWQLPYTWVVSAPSELRVDLLTPPADAFFEEVIELRPLTPAQQEQLVQLRLGPAEQTPWRLGSEGEENPRRLLEIVRDSIRRGESPDGPMRARAERETSVSALGRAASMLYAELEDYGPASASDQEFLDRLGWSRQRAARILGELERLDFLRSDYQPAKNGRPRRVFSIVPPTNR